MRQRVSDIWRARHLVALPLLYVLVGLEVEALFGIERPIAYGVAIVLLVLVILPWGKIVNWFRKTFAKNTVFYDLEDLEREWEVISRWDDTGTQLVDLMHAATNPQPIKQSRHVRTGEIREHKHPDSKHWSNRRMQRERAELGK